MNMSYPQTSANNCLKRFSNVLEENNNQMDVDVDIVETPVFEEKQPRGRGRGRRMGGFRGGRGGRGRATMNLTYPKQSANDRLQRSAEVLTYLIELYTPINSKKYSGKYSKDHFFSDSTLVQIRQKDKVHAKLLNGLF